MSEYPIKNNRFYNQFDCEFFGKRNSDDYRTPFQRDRDRIIHSSALRRLQAKTQVFLSGEYDFYRTRLTHSIEVAQIGRAICLYLQQQSPLLRNDFFIDPDLVEAVCLAHDLGHPPFGHAGESTLNRLMQHHGGFEGNAQTLRMLTEIIYSDGPARSGMSPTRALMDGVLKYKACMSEFKNPERYFIYDDQEKYLQFVFDGHEFPADLPPGKKRNRFRSIECQIMDWADDTAYSLNDIIDGINAKFISRPRLEAWGNNNALNSAESRLLEKLLKTMKAGTVEREFSRKIGKCIESCRLLERENFMSGHTNRYRYRLQIDEAALQEVNFYKKIAFDVVFDSPQLQQLKYKWKFILNRMFIALTDTYLNDSASPLNLLPETLHQQVVQSQDEHQKTRIICDHIAGMTDRFAIRTYQRLFDPGFGSIADLI